jgi:predicted Zn-ribbon and HTH transcriptional regulator
MRKLLVGALMGVLALAVTAIAMAESEQSGTTTQNYTQTYSQKKGGKPTGTTFQTTSSNSANEEQNKQPKRATNFDITFPKGTKINNKAVPACSAGEAEFNQVNNPDEACPKGSKIGAGKVSARLPYPNTAELNGTVTAYNAKKGLLLYVVIQAPGAAQTLVLKPTFHGLTLKTAVPVTCVPPGTAENGCKASDGKEYAAVLTAFSLKTKVASAKGKTLITTPAKCAKGGWDFSAAIKYADGTGVKIPTKAPCK